MVNRHTALKIRKTHRYLGLFLGIQFLFWTISGLYLVGRTSMKYTETNLKTWSVNPKHLIV